MRVPMIATKSMRYATRQLVADDEFEATDRGQARLLTALGRARQVEDKPTSDPLDHDGNGKKGGSPKGEKATRRKKAAAPEVEG